MFEVPWYVWTSLSVFLILVGLAVLIMASAFHSNDRCEKKKDWSDR